MKQLDLITDAAKAASHNYSLMTVVLFWAGLVIMSSLYITIPLITTFTDIFKVTPVQAAWASSSFSLCFAIACLFYGPLSDRFGRKSIILIGLFVLSAISLLMGLITNLFWLVLFRGLQGAAAATFSPVALAYVVEVYPPQKRITAIGFISAGFLMAGIFGQIFSSYISQHYGWNIVFCLLGIIYAGTGLLILWLIPRSSAIQGHTSIVMILKQMGTVLTQKALLCSYTIALTLLLSFVGMYTVLNHYLSSPLFEFTTQQILYVRSMGIIGMLLSPYAGQLVKVYGLLAILRSGLLMAIFGLLMLGRSTVLLWIVVASILFVSGIAISAPALIALIGRLGGKSNGAAVSVYTFTLFAGASIGPLLALNILKSGSYFFAFLVLASCLCLGLLTSYFIRIDDGVKATV